MKYYFLLALALLIIPLALAANATNNSTEINYTNTSNYTSDNQTQTNVTSNQTNISQGRSGINGTVQTNTTNISSTQTNSSFSATTDRTLLKQHRSYAAFFKNTDNNEVRLELQPARDKAYFAIQRQLTNPSSENTGSDSYFIENDKEQIHVYPLTNGFEYEVTLLEDPGSNVLEFSLSASGYDLRYQPPLDVEYNDSDCNATHCNGRYRPIDVVHSYAVYETNPTSGTGKVFHIYRPWAEDDSGNRVWGALNYDDSTSTLEVILPDGFLENAAYPVLVDPTFGYASAGASTEVLFDDNCMFPGQTTYNRVGVALETNESAQIDNITAYLVDFGMPPCTSPSTAVKVKYFLNEENASGAMNHTQLAYAEDTSYNLVGGGAWHTIDLTDTNFSVGGNIIISAAANASANKYVGIAFDSGSGNSYDDSPASGSYNPHESPWTPINHGPNDYSIYASYTTVCIPSFTNTSWTNTANSSCQMNGYYESTWQATEYDIYSCPGSSNTTHTIYNDTFTCSLPSSGTITIGPGYINAQSLYMVNNYWGISNNYSFWMCTSSDCSSTCQADIRGGLITACN